MTSPEGRASCDIICPAEWRFDKFSTDEINAIHTDKLLQPPSSNLIGIVEVQRNA